MLKIYGSDLSSPANKVRYAAMALGLEFEYIKINLREGEHKKPEFMKIHPAGKVPAIDDNGFYLFESNAIIKYLAGKSSSNLYPKDLQEKAVVDQWIDFSSFHVGDGMNRVVYNRVFAPRRNMPIDEESIKVGLSYLDKYFPIIDNQLSKNKYLAGNKLTLADINPEAIKCVPAALAAKYILIPIDKVENILTVVMSDPSNEEALLEIEAVSQCRIQTFVGTVSDIEKAIRKHYKLADLDAARKTDGEKVKMSFKSVIEEKLKKEN